MNLSISGLLLSILLLLPLTLHAEDLRYTVPEPHRHNVFVSRFTPDGTRIVSVDDDGVLIEWDFINKRILRRVKAPFTPSDMGMTLTRDTTKAAYVGKNGRTVVYNRIADTFTEIPFAMPAGKDKEREACAIAISDNGKVVFVGDSYGALYRSENGAPFVPFTPVGKLNRREEQVTALALSPDGKTLAVGRLGMIKLIHAESGEPVWMLPHDQISFSISISFSPDSKLVSAGIPGRISVGHANQELPVWEVKSGRKLHSFTMTDGMAFFGGFSRDNKLALCASSYSSYLFDLATGKQVGSSFLPEEKRDSRYFMDTSPDGKYLLVTGSQGLLQVYETARILTDKEPKPFVTMENRVSAVKLLKFSPDGGALLVGNEDSMPQVFDLKEKKMHERLECGHEVREFIFTGNSTKLLAAGPYLISQWQWPSLEKLPGVEFDDEERNSGFIASPDGKQGVSLDYSVLVDGHWKIPALQTVDLEQGTKGKQFLLLEEKKDSFRETTLQCADFSAKKAVVRTQDGRALEYSLGDGKQLRQVDSVSKDTDVFDCEQMKFVSPKIILPKEKLQHAWRYQFAISGRYLAESEEGTISITDLEKKTVSKFATFATPVGTDGNDGNEGATVALSPDGGMLAIGTNKGDVGLYDVKKRKLIGTYLYLGYKEWLWYTPDGSYNASPNAAELVWRVGKGAEFLGRLGGK